MATAISKVSLKICHDKLRSFQMELSKISLKRTVGGWLKLKNRLKTGDVQREKLATYLMQYATLQMKAYYYYWIRLSSLSPLLKGGKKNFVKNFRS
jgi:hypothetical protein